MADRSIGTSKELREKTDVEEEKMKKGSGSGFNSESGSFFYNNDVIASMEKILGGDVNPINSTDTASCISHSCNNNNSIINDNKSSNNNSNSCNNDNEDSNSNNNNNNNKYNNEDSNNKSNNDNNSNYIYSNSCNNGSSSGHDDMKSNLGGHLGLGSTQDMEHSTQIPSCDKNIIGRCVDCSCPYDSFSGLIVCTVCRLPVLVCTICAVEKCYPGEYHCFRHRFKILQASIFTVLIFLSFLLSFFLSFFLPPYFFSFFLFYIFPFYIFPFYIFPFLDFLSLSIFFISSIGLIISSLLCVISILVILNVQKQASQVYVLYSTRAFHRVSTTPTNR